MDPKELRGLMEAYSEVYAPEQLDEISQKTATRAYAASKTGEFEGADSDRDLKRTDNLEKHIKRKFGDKAVKHAEKAADVQTFGRKDASGRRKQSPQPRIQTNDHENQREFKRELKIRRDRRLRAAREDTNEQVDIFDVVLEFLQAEGYAETLEEAEWMMANIIDEEAVAIILGEGKVELDQERRSRMGRQIGKKVRSADAEYSLSKDTMYPKGLRGAMEKGARKKVGQAQKIMGALKSAQKEEYELDEAQAARENPEKYEREQSKKSAPVRGERTPMPPRGDKRREDFEKWYAANVR
jgi:hypothetical protein